MGHHKAGHHHKMEDEFKVGKDNEPVSAEAEAKPMASPASAADETSGTAEQQASDKGTEFSRPQKLQQRFRELKVAGNDALGDLRHGFGGAAREVRSGLGTAISQIRQSMTKAAERFNGVLQRPKAGEGRHSAH